MARVRFLFVAWMLVIASGALAQMREAAQAVIASVEASKRPKLVLAFEDATRMDWHYTPRSRPGLSFADLDARGREAVHGLLRTALSEAGHRRVVNILELELVLRESPFGLSLIRDPEKYSIVFFGAPDAAKPWAWRFEGHHLSLHFTLRGDRVASTPSFFGANPAEVRSGPRKGLRALAPEEDEARKLFALLDDAQRRAVVIDSRSYGDIVTTNKDRVSPIDNRGLEARTMTTAQRAQLRKLIEVYADSFEPSLRAARLARVDEGGMEAVRVAWAGVTARGTGSHYYRIQGPKFLIEYDASQDDGNHVHTVWRDFTGDFGRDLLREHYSMQH